MSQQSLFSPQIRNVARAIERKAIKIYCDTDKHAESNQIAALAILEDVEKYGGESAALVRWSRMVISK